MAKKVFVSGCFDLIHAGHVEFLQTASKYGSELYVSVGSDENVFLLKKVKPTYSQEERVFILNALECVTEAFVSSGMGVMDFVDDFKRIKPDYFVVNYDGANKEKEKLCKDYNVEYIVLDRVPHKGLPKRSSTDLRGLLG